MGMLEKIVHKVLFRQIVGDGVNATRNDAVMVGKAIEDVDFQGRDDRHLPVGERVSNLLSAMTFEEKVRYAGGYKEFAVQPIERLGLPSIWASDATSGLRCFPGGTAFLAGIAMAATWDPELIEKLGAIIGEEFRARGISILLGPGVNIYRVPTCGRNFEYMGEDPFLAGKISAAYIRGAQRKGVLTTVKHFAANNSDYDRHKTDSVVDERTLREIYLPAFRMAVQEGGSLGVMNSYNQVNGVYASEHEFLLKKILRGEWGYKGFVISDWNSVYATVPAVKNGLNLEMPSGKWINLKTVSRAIEAGELAEKDIDDMIEPILRTLLDAGVYDRPQIDPDARIRTPDHLGFAEEAAESGVVLLKNEGGVLPLNPENVKKIVVMGRTAKDTPTGGGGSSYIHRPERVDILDGIQARFPDSQVDFISFRKNRLNLTERELIRNADAVVLGAGFFTLEESEFYDRAWELPERQADLIRAVAELNPNLVVVLTTGGGVETESWIHQIPAVIHSFFLGEFGGKTIAKILSGAANPGGKLPFTMAKQWKDFESTQYYVEQPEKTSFRQVVIGQGNPKVRKVWPMVYGEGLRVGYRHFDTAGIKPQFAFGHGLSYTSFELSNLSVKKDRGAVGLSVTVTNTGNRAGAEVVQCYVHDVEASVFRPEQELKAFAKIHLGPGEAVSLQLALGAEAFAFFDVEEGKWQVEAGEFEIRVGTSSRDIHHAERIVLP